MTLPSRPPAGAVNGTRTRGPFEQGADRTALGRLADDAVRQVLETDADRIQELLVEDAEQYGPFDRA